MPIRAGSSACGSACRTSPVADTWLAALDRRSGRWRVALCLGAGVVTGLGQVPFSLLFWPLGLVVAARLGAVAGTVRRAALTGWLTGVGYFATTLHWIVEPFLVDPVRHGWMAPFALLFTATGFALFWGAAFGLARWIARGRWGFALALALALGMAELARSYVLTGFPWALLGYVWSETPAAQLAAWIGPHGLTLLTLLSVVLAGEVLSRHRWAGSGALIAAVVLPVALGLAVRPAPRAISPKAPVVRLVQPNAPQDEKWDPALAPVFFERQLKFTRAEGSPDLIVWPETAIPWLLKEDLPALDRISDAAGDVPVVLGAQRVEGVRAYNSLALLGPDGRIREIYDKHHLVPFGEFVPLGSLARLVGLRSFAARDGYGFSPGPGPGAELLDLGPLGRALPLICYEAIFPQDVAAAPERPDFLLQITNDAWFGTFSGPYQHLAQARMRAIEQRLPMVRAANTGVSAVIGPAGRVLASLPLGTAGYLDHALPPPGRPGLYARTGDWSVALLLGVGLLGLALRKAARRAQSA